jgi:hypothetical protein
MVSWWSKLQKNTTFSSLATSSSVWEFTIAAYKQHLLIQLNSQNYHVVLTEEILVRCIHAWTPWNANRWQCRYLDSCDLFRRRANNFRSMCLLCGVLRICQLSWSKCFGRYLLCLFLSLFRVKLLCCCNPLLQKQKKDLHNDFRTKTEHAH